VTGEANSWTVILHHPWSHIRQCISVSTISAKVFFAVFVLLWFSLLRGSLFSSLL
jgi:hypothetical protein